MRMIFMGSPEFAVPSLHQLAGQFEVAGVYCQPDKPAGRGKKIKPPAVKRAAIELGLPVHQPQSVKDIETIHEIDRLAPEMIVVAAYGKILPEEILDLPRFGVLNVHASLLPRWRGAAPIPAAILHGDKETGVTIMKLVLEMDAGAILAQGGTPIRNNETTGELTSRLSKLGADLLLKTITPYISGDIVPVEQDERFVTFAPRLKKSDGILNFSQTATLLERQVRAFNPWPSAFFNWDNRRIIVHEAHVSNDRISSPGSVFEIEGFPAVGTQDGSLVLDLLQPAGKKPMTGDQFLRGSRGILNSKVD
jgi:methionyl-tRNA formyltransferase